MKKHQLLTAAIMCLFILTLTNHTVHAATPPVYQKINSNIFITIAPGTSTPIPTNTPTSTPTPTVAPTSTLTPTISPTPTFMPTVTGTTTSEASGSPTVTTTPTLTQTPAPQKTLIAGFTTGEVAFGSVIVLLLFIIVAQANSAKIKEWLHRKPRNLT